MFRKLIISVSAVLLSTVSVAAADPFDNARYYLQTKENQAALQIIDSGQFDVNMQTDEGYSLLHYAAGAGNLEMVKALLERGADPNLKSAIGMTPYQMAIGTMVKAEIRKAMTRAPVPPSTASTGPEPLAFASPATPGRSNGMCAMVRAEKINDGRSPALRPFLKAKDAIWYNHPDELTGLIEDCVDVNQQDEYGWSLLHQAADRDRVDLARILLSHGARKDLRNKDGQTAPQLAKSPEMKALLGFAEVQRPAPAEQGSAGNKVECEQKFRADAALSSDETGRSRAYRRWQQCLKTGLYW
ncbi:ankyrin repeat domain-containing protein [Sphingomonas jeddahensis]|uniref:Ankyrin repeats (3 copies) n=1 Tax=Sphingomonas jeddahensis TaxID=1915074 RepID=A0A1V2EQU7_9SPHN|nr:ankyrin repeat domain-containing protein [Sphingomonas jeddahensis]ONF95042.1 Ankyrin repeats (3 copies) [Sphingomonas jeddahensis]